MPIHAPFLGVSCGFDPQNRKTSTKPVKESYDLLAIKICPAVMKSTVRVMKRPKKKDKERYLIMANRVFA